MTKAIQLTPKQLRLDHYNRVITKNKSKFKTGSTFSRDDLVQLFNVQDIVNTGNYVDIQRSNLKLVTVQMEINMLMRENGLYLASKNYYSQFTVLKKKATKKTVIRYSAEVDINKVCTTRLEAKLKERVTNNTWGTYNKVSTARISTMGSTTPSIRHERTINRVKTI